MKQNKILEGKAFAILAMDGFEESELLKPREALETCGADVDIVSVKDGTIKAWTKDQWGEDVDVDQVLSEISVGDYDGLVLPGGVINADTLRTHKDAVKFVCGFIKEGKPIAAICHAAWTLIETGYVKGHRMTSWPSLRTDLENAGAHWVDQEVVVDQGWVTSRKPADIPAFNAKMIEVFKEGTYEDFTKTHRESSQSDSHRPVC